MRDTQPPTLFLLPYSALRWSTPAGASGTPARQGVIARLVVGGPAYTEDGWFAADNTDPAVQGAVRRRFAEYVTTASPTAPDTPYVITYDVSDASGNAAPTQVGRVCARMRGRGQPCHKDWITGVRAHT